MLVCPLTATKLKFQTFTRKIWRRKNLIESDNLDESVNLFSTYRERKAKRNQIDHSHALEWWKHCRWTDRQSTYYNRTLSWFVMLIKVIIAPRQKIVAIWNELNFEPNKHVSKFFVHSTPSRNYDCQHGVSRSETRIMPDIQFLTITAAISKYPRSNGCLWKSRMFGNAFHYRLIFRCF